MLETWTWKEYRGIKWLNTPYRPFQKDSRGNGWEIAIINMYRERCYQTHSSYPVILVEVLNLVDRELRGCK
jgi:hypothetical protein